MQLNPYPKEIVDETSGTRGFNIKHIVWQQGYEAGWNEAKGIVSQINWETDDLRSFERMILAALGTLPREENKRR